MKPNHVHVEGPESEPGYQGDEIPVWYVTLCFGDIIGDCNHIKTYKCYSFEKAVGLGEAIARDRNIELVQEAITA